MIWYIHHVPVHCVPVHVTPRPNEVTHSKCWGVRQHSPTPLKNPSILRQNLLHVKQPSKPRHIWSQAAFYIRHLSLKYKYKERARNRTLKTTPKSSHKSAPKMAVLPPKPPIRWMVSLRETIHPGQVSFSACRQTLNRNPKGAPTIHHLTNSETANADRFQSGSVRCWRVSGRSPDQSECGADFVKAVLHSGSCPTLQKQKRKFRMRNPCVFGDKICFVEPPIAGTTKLLVRRRPTPK